MKPLPRIEGEVQRYQIGPDGDEWVKADDYAALNDYAALVQMERDMARAEVERLTGCLTQANAQAERFERQWYLRGDELDRLRAALEKIRDMAERAQQPQAARSDPELNAYGNMCRFLADIWMDAKRAASPTTAP